MIDRFGDVPPEAEHLMWIALLKALSARLQIERVFLRGGKVVFRFSPSATLDGAKLVFALNKAKSDLVLQRSGTGTVLLLNRAGEPEQLMELAVDALEKVVPAVEDETNPNVQRKVTE